MFKTLSTAASSTRKQGTSAQSYMEKIVRDIKNKRQEGSSTEGSETDCVLFNNNNNKENTEVQGLPFLSPE